MVARIDRNCCNSHDLQPVSLRWHVVFRYVWDLSGQLLHCFFCPSRAKDESILSYLSSFLDLMPWCHTDSALFWSDWCGLLMQYSTSSHDAWILPSLGRLLLTSTIRCDLLRVAKITDELLPPQWMACQWFLLHHICLYTLWFICKDFSTHFGRNWFAMTNKGVCIELLVPQLLLLINSVGLISECRQSSKN